mgnify:CR=1 FL=1
MPAVLCMHSDKLRIGAVLNNLDVPLIFQRCFLSNIWM